MLDPDRGCMKPLMAGIAHWHYVPAGDFIAVDGTEPQPPAFAVVEVVYQICPVPTTDAEIECCCAGSLALAVPVACIGTLTPLCFAPPDLLLHFNLTPATKCLKDRMERRETARSDVPRSTISPLPTYTAT